MKPIITYKRDSLLPLELSNRSLICKRDGSEFANKQELTDFVDTLYVPPTSDTYILANCSCSRNYSYATKEDVPEENINCVCERKILEYI